MLFYEKYLNAKNVDFFHLVLQMVHKGNKYANSIYELNPLKADLQSWAKYLEQNREIH